MIDGSVLSLYAVPIALIVGFSGVYALFLAGFFLVRGQAIFVERWGALLRVYFVTLVFIVAFSLVYILGTLFDQYLRL